MRLLFSLARDIIKRKTTKGGICTYDRWLQKHTDSLAGKTVAVTGSTGGLGKPLCRYLAALGAHLVLLDRSAERASAHKAALQQEFPDCRVTLLQVDLSDMVSVTSATDTLLALPLDIFIHNAGAYAIPRKTCDTGLDNVFQINFVSPYYMIRRLLPLLRARHGHVMAVGSIAHTYSKIDPSDLDFSTRSRASLVYGNAKRHLMFALLELFKSETDVTLSLTHPGITFTNITAHYPPLIFAVIKHPMKIIFMPPRKAALSLLYGIFEPCGSDEWIGPRRFRVWGLPRKEKLRTCKPSERAEIAARADHIYQSLTKEQTT